jgi:hypothetical protein
MYVRARDEQALCVGSKYYMQGGHYCVFFFPASPLIRVSQVDTASILFNLANLLTHITMASGGVQGVLQLLLPTGISTASSIFLLLVYLFGAYLVGSAIYSVTLYPLASVPGPTSCAVSRLPYWLHLLKGKQRLRAAAPATQPIRACCTIRSQ